METDLTLRKDGESLSYAVTLTLDEEGLDTAGWQDLEEAAEVLRDRCDVLRAFAKARRLATWHRLRGEIQDARRWEDVADDLHSDVSRAWRD